MGLNPGPVSLNQGPIDNTINDSDDLIHAIWLHRSVAQYPSPTESANALGGEKFPSRQAAAECGFTLGLQPRASPGRIGRAFRTRRALAAYT